MFTYVNNEDREAIIRKWIIAHLRHVHGNGVGANTHAMACSSDGSVTIDAIFAYRGNVHNRYVLAVDITVQLTGIPIEASVKGKQAFRYQNEKDRSIELLALNSTRHIFNSIDELKKGKNG